MKTYKVKVNGKVYLVEVEEVGNAEDREALKGTDKETVKETAPAANDERIESPMQGTIFAIKVSPGDRITRGQVVAVLDAMKMENDLVSPVDGTVSNVYLKVGDIVDSGALIMTVRTK
ncbi:MAG TPA: biotin/lipoyl-containing protein [Clostridiaceae bacterium]|nr:biotin/lipoyl-containing protein [Clostridiaceae bacterium]